MTPNTLRTGGTPASAAPTVCRGKPGRLMCSLTIEVGAGEFRAGARVTAALQGAEVQGVTVFGSTAAHPELRVSLQARSTTAPGRYPGSLQIGGLTVPIVAEVEPSPRVRCEPSRLLLDVKPRGTVTRELMLHNTGNVPCVVPITSTFCLFDGHGIDHAVWVALTGEPTPEKQRIDLLLDDLAESHGGLVRARTAKGQDPISPGETRTVQLRLRFSERIRPQRRYVGAWDLDGLRLPVRVTAVGAKPSSNEREDEDT
jgi:hypothetical protein